MDFAQSNRGGVMRLIATLAVLALMTGCGDKGGGSQNDLAVSACDAYAKTQLADKTYELDHDALAASMVDTGGGSKFLKGPITVEPGRASESKQTLECTVRFVEGKELPDVLKMQFIW
jgi:hypothetical protein